MRQDRSSELVEIDDHGDVLVVRVVPTHLLDDSPRALKREVGGLIADPSVRVVILDLAAVTMVASDAVGILVGLLAEGRKRAVDLVLVGLRPRVAEVFHLCQLLTDDPTSGAFRTHPDVGTAMAAVRRASRGLNAGTGTPSC